MTKPIIRYSNDEVIYIYLRSGHIYVIYVIIIFTLLVTQDVFNDLGQNKIIKTMSLMPHAL
jgi:hypothetical protein